MDWSGISRATLRGRVRVIALGVLVAVVLVLPACSSDGSTNGGSSLAVRNLEELAASVDASKASDGDLRAECPLDLDAALERFNSSTGIGVPDTLFTVTGSGETPSLFCEDLGLAVIIAETPFPDTSLADLVDDPPPGPDDQIDAFVGLLIEALGDGSAVAVVDNLIVFSDGGFAAQQDGLFFLYLLNVYSLGGPLEQPSIPNETMIEALREFHDHVAECVVSGRCPEIAAEGGPRLNRDNWRAAYGVWDCAEGDSGAWLPIYQTIVPDPLGIHSHQDGLIHIHPFSPDAAGPRAQLEDFLTTMGAAITDDSLIVEGGRVLTEDTDCAGEPAVIQVLRWNHATDLDSEPDIFTEDMGEVPFANDGELWILARAPLGADIPPPPSLSMLAEDRPDLFESSQD